ncbi:MAG: apolipoprotein N-acyltransferase [Pseudomonadota bacterium]|jgi:apolipoprotein N-acyltransferase
MIINFAILFIGGLLSVLAFAPFQHSICILISLLSLFWWLEHSHSVTTKSRYCGCLIYALGYFTAQLYWIFYSLDIIIKTGLIVAILAQLAFSLIMAIFIIFSVMLFQRLKTQSHELNYLILFPSCWVIMEWLRGWIFTGFPWCDIAYTQVNNSLFKGIFPILGVYGVSWISLSISGFLYLVLIKRNNLLGNKPHLSMAQQGSIIYFAIIILVSYLTNSIQYTENYGSPIKVGLIQQNIDQAAKWDKTQFVKNLTEYANTIAKTKAEVVVLPETAFPLFESDLPLYYIKDIVSLAKMNKAELVVGMPRIIDQQGSYASAAVVLTKEGHPYYAKKHLVPFGEYTPLANWLGGLYNLFDLPMVGFSSGKAKQPLLVLAQQKFAFNICYENGFASELIKDASQSTIMANISDMVWFGNTIAPYQHLELSQARALENQRYFIQDTNTGATAIIQDNGHIQSQLSPFSQGVLVDYVQGKIGTTPYQHYGNYLIISLISLILLGFLWSPKATNKNLIN